jgi:molybdopterin molybdotransferase
MLELEEARRRILATLQPLPVEVVSLSAAPGRVLAESVVAPIDLPSFDNSAVDGYAVRATDLSSVRAGAPAILDLVGRVPAGDVFSGTVQPGACLRIFTGSALPAGADAVVLQEDTRCDGEQPGKVQFLERASPWEHVRLRGEDVKRGAALVASGERATAGHIGLLAASGLREIKVRRQPVVGLLATGSELVESGNPLAPGKLYESNRQALAPLLARSGALPRLLPLVADTLEETKRALEQAFAGCDALVTTGGVSVGELDFVKQAFEEIGGSMDFWKVAVKPGKPFAFGQWRQKLLFGLPGNPVSAIVTFLLLVRPALWRWQGATNVDPPARFCILADPLANPGDRRHFMRVRVDAAGNARSAGAQASHLLSSLASADGLVDVPPNTSLPAGTLARLIPFED